MHGKPASSNNTAQLRPAASTWRAHPWRNSSHAYPSFVIDTPTLLTALLGPRDAVAMSQSGSHWSSVHDEARVLMSGMSSDGEPKVSGFGSGCLPARMQGSNIGDGAGRKNFTLCPIRVDYKGNDLWFDWIHFCGMHACMHGWHACAWERVRACVCWFVSECAGRLPRLLGILQSGGGGYPA